MKPSRQSYPTTRPLKGSGVFAPRLPRGGSVAVGLVALVVCLAAATGRPAAHAEEVRGEVVERVVATVNGEALFLSELRGRAAPFLQRLMEAPEEQRPSLVAQLYGDLLTQLIDESLIEQESRDMQVQVSSDDVQRAIDNVKRQSGMDEDEFWDAVAGQGFTQARYRADVRRQLVRLRVINQKVRARINLTEVDVRRRYDQMVRKARLKARFHVAHIFLPVQQATATTMAAARKQADRIRGGVSDVATFEKAMADEGGGDLGWLTQGDLSPELEDALLELEPGEISAPVRGPAGLHIFLLRERQEGEQTVGPYEQLRGDLYRQMLDAAMAKQEAVYLRELRKRSLIDRRI